jgi:hypothetical protein
MSSVIGSSVGKAGVWGFIVSRELGEQRRGTLVLLWIFWDIGGKWMPAFQQAELN